MGFHTELSNHHASDGHRSSCLLHTVLGLSIREVLHLFSGLDPSFTFILLSFVIITVPGCRSVEASQQFLLFLSPNPRSISRELCVFLLFSSNYAKGRLMVSSAHGSKSAAEKDFAEILHLVQPSIFQTTKLLFNIHFYLKILRVSI